jgi:hypothetical protein
MKTFDKRVEVRVNNETLKKWATFCKLSKLSLSEVLRRAMSQYILITSPKLIKRSQNNN